VETDVEELFGLSAQDLVIVEFRAASPWRSNRPASDRNSRAPSGLDRSRRTELERGHVRGLRAHARRASAAARREILARDFFLIPIASFKRLIGFVVMELGRRRIVCKVTTRRRLGRRGHPSSPLVRAPSRPPRSREKRRSVGDLPGWCFREAQEVGTPVGSQVSTGLSIESGSGP
jgi:hypothetical protein